VEAGLTKKEIRLLSRKMGLLTRNKPSFTCLYSRFPCGMEISKEKIYKVSEAEEYLQKLGFEQVRVRFRESYTAGIEVPQNKIRKLAFTDLRQRIAKRLKQIGFNCVTLDLEEYGAGSMNEILRYKGKGSIS